MVLTPLKQTVLHILFRLKLLVHMVMYDLSGATLKVIKGKNSADFTTSSVFQDSPILTTLQVVQQLVLVQFFCNYCSRCGDVPQKR